jgi:beta-lactam-binding protein with PASTA domain
MKTFGFDLNAAETYVGSHLRLFLSLALAALFFAGMAALSVFFIAVKGREEVMVPDVTGQDLTRALLVLQEKELYPRIQLRTSSSAEDKGMILEQNPEGGTVVKAERRISLTISSGVALDKVGNYLGRNVSDVRTDIAGISALSLKEPFMYQFAPEPAGTVIQQNPPAGADLTGPVSLELVVSRGQENVRSTVPDLYGLSLQTALERLAPTGIYFDFEIKTAEGAEKPETVYSQSISAGREIGAEKLTLTLTAPVPSEDETAGLFRYTLPRNPYPLPLTVDALLPGGGRRRLVSVTHPGGAFALPYRLPSGSVIVLSMLDRELYRQTAQPASGGDSGLNESRDQF